MSRALYGVLAALLLAALPAAAQNENSSILGTVRAAQGGTALPGVTVTLTGVGAPRLFVTNSEGQFRFQNVGPGNYRLQAELDGYSPVEYTDLDIRGGRNYTFDVQMSAAVEDTIVVTSAAPALDERKITQSVSISEEELAKIPTARDPWSFVTQAPGVVTDRINVGGNESGQQPNFVGTGALSDQNSFMVDGVDITDLTALGSSSTYFGFGQFEELNISTGGTDVTTLTPGVQVNLITKRGTNQWSGSARYFDTDDSFQSGSNLDRGDLGPGQEAADPAELTPNQVQSIKEYGIEAGGPVLRDHLWAWGSYDKNDITQSVFGGTPDNTLLENRAGKLNAQFDPSTSGVFSYNWGDKAKNGRGAGPSRAPETTWDQTGPTTIWKAQASRVFTPNFLATLTYGYVDGGFQLLPKGGIESPVYQGPDGVFRNSFAFLDTDRNSTEYQGDASYFFNAGGTGHELKFGAQHREHENLSNYGFGGSQLSIDGPSQGLPAGYDLVLLWRNQTVRDTVKYDAAWLQDTITWDRLTINAGLRYDKQKATNDPVLQPASPVAPRLGDINFPGNDAGGFSWDTVSPRIGLTYALGEGRKTLLRASYSRFASQLGSSIPVLVNPTLYAYGVYAFQDTNGNHLVDPGEEGNLSFLAPVNFDPDDPNSIVSPNRIDSNLSPETTDEIVFGVERELLPAFVVGARLSWRQTTDILEDHRLIRDGNGVVREATRDDYILDPGLDPELDPNGDGFIEGTLPTGATYNVPVYTLRPGLTDTGGSLYTNGDRETDYKGLALTFDRRMRNGWSLRGYANFYDWTWKIGPEFRHFDDPTNEDNASGDPLEIADDNGGAVAEQSGGSGNVTPFMNSKWSAGVTGIVTLPWDFHLAANLSARQGFPLAYFRTVTVSDGSQTDVQLVGDVDKYRNPNVYLVDLGLDREFQFQDVNLTLRLDGFNLLNEGFVLQRERDAGTSRAGYIDQIVGPRIFRLGAKISFR